MTETIHVTGMSCEHCVRAVTAALSAVEGVSSVDVHLDSGVVTFESARPVDGSAIAAAIDEAGYELAR
jgi:copper ion binding protein